MYETRGFMDDRNRFEHDVLETLRTDPSVVPFIPAPFTAEYARGVVRIGARLPSPAKAGLVLGGIGVAVALLRGKGIIGPAIGWGAAGALGAIVLDVVTIGSYTMGFSDASTTVGER